MPVRSFATEHGGSGQSTGLWPNDFKLIEPSHAGYLPAQELLAVATGSQGELRTVLWQLANAAIRPLSWKPGDTVIFSARTIPGNEPAVARLQSAPEKPVGASGYSGALRPAYSCLGPSLSVDELRQMYQPGRTSPSPRMGKPPTWLKMHRSSAPAMCSYTLTGTNGDLFLLEGALLPEESGAGRLFALTPEGFGNQPTVQQFRPDSG